ncbi:hypothetical protein FNO09_24305 [Salmonella enterica subsp. diarizonae]|nr:hypothetical protein [Salmonella enterica subsp. diarizonae]
MDVSVPVVDGKEIKDYDEDLRNKAREVITKIYKEIICGENDVGEQSTMLIQAANSSSIQMMQASIDELKEQITRLKEEKHPKKEAIKPFGIKDGEIVMSAQRIALITPSPKDCLEERATALEKHLFAEVLTSKISEIEQPFKAEPGVIFISNVTIL